MAARRAGRGPGTTRMGAPGLGSQPRMGNRLRSRKYVVSSASGFTEKAAAHGAILVGGLQTMCFLLGAPDRYRAEWER